MKNLALDKYLPGVSRLSYGCMGLGGGWDVNEITKSAISQAHDVVDAAMDIGINLFDHADIYSKGKAETVFGEVLKARPELREQLFLQSKCAIRFEDESGPKRYDCSSEWINQSVDEILQRLKTDYLDILLLHRPDPLMEPEVVAETLSALKKSGKVRHFGVSNMQQHQIAFLQHYLDSPIIVNQIELSLEKLDWLEEGILAGNTIGNNVNFTAGTLEHCYKNDIQVQSWGSLAQGLFSGRDVSALPAHIQASAALVSELAKKYSVSPEAIVLAWLQRHPVNIQAVIGTTDLERIKACGDVSRISLDRNDWYKLYESARGHEVP